MKRAKKANKANKANLLFLVHVEPMFEAHFPPMFRQRLARAVRCKKYDRIIHMTSHVMDDAPIPELMGYNKHGIYSKLEEQIDWGWGYCTECFSHDEDELKWLIPTSSPHTTTWVPPELRTFHWNNYNVYIGGGCESECLQGFEDVLEFLNVPFTKINGYVYGN